MRELTCPRYKRNLEMKREYVKARVVDFGSLIWIVMTLAESLIVFGLKC